MSDLGKNVQAEVKGDKLVLTVDLSVKGEASKSGKSLVIGSTQGNKKVQHDGEDISIGLNVYKKKGDL